MIDLSEHVAISVTYLGGHGDSYTLNFSRPATGVYVQLYQFLRLGKVGYSKMIEHQLKVAGILRDRLKKMMYKGKPRFEIMDATVHGHQCLPVVAARLNPELGLHYDDIDLQHAIAEHQWYCIIIKKYYVSSCIIVHCFVTIKVCLRIRIELQPSLDRGEPPSFQGYSW